MPVNGEAPAVLTGQSARRDDQKQTQKEVNRLGGLVIILGCHIIDVIR